METTIGSGWSAWGGGRLAMACAMAGLVGGTGGCRPEEAPVETTPRMAETAVAEMPSPAGGWIAMEKLEPGKWEAINGAADLDWDDEARVLRIGVGTDLNGVRWTGELPTVPYEVELEARRMIGRDFFCGLTFPVRDGERAVTLIVGGWGGNLVGISSINGLDASENSTGSDQPFEDQRWYRIRVEVRDEHLQAWIDGRQVVDAHTEGYTLSLRQGAIEDCAPFGLATWVTAAEARGARWRQLPDEPEFRD